jgi:outer membrane protein assembly factor BamB
MLDAASGRELWRTSAGAPLVAGVGSDGTTAAVVTRDNDLVAFAAARKLWRQKLAALVHRAAGGRQPRLRARGDRSVSAFDGQTGRRLWSQQRPASRWCCASPACCWPWATRWWPGRAAGWSA